MSRITLSGLFGVLLCSSALSLRAGELEVAPPPKRIYNQDEQTPSDFRGRVIAFNGDVITIKPEGSVRILTTRFLGNGKKEFSIYAQDNMKPPMSFLLTANAKQFGGANRVGQHKFSEVQVGDIVLVGCFYYRDELVMYCGAVEIHRRPGGKVPPAIGDDSLSKEHQHLRAFVLRNNEQFAEETASELPFLLLRNVPR